METIQFIQERFREYYLKHGDSISSPNLLEKREFGFIPFRKEKMMIRHRGFRNSSQLKEFVKFLVPSDAYYSSAYYHNPDAETMSEKKWISADLIFDVDCDHIYTSCKTEHDRWECSNCKTTGVGEPPERCPECKMEKIGKNSWICERCLETAKQETLKLTDILEEDFGISGKEMTAVFSGHRGYHIHVENDYTNKLNSMERKELVDYITATGLKVEHHGLLREKHITSGPTMIDLGWGGRIGKAVYTILLKDVEELKRIKLTDDIIKKITEKREQILDAWQRGEGWNQLSEIKKSAREKIIKEALIHGAAFIDTVVTTDTHRLIRLPNTLHGKTGLRVIEMPINKLPDFEPLRDAISFREEFYSINVKDAPSIQIEEKKYGPFKSTSIKLPAAVAMFYLCKNRATLAQSL